MKYRPGDVLLVRVTVVEQERPKPDERDRVELVANFSGVRISLKHLDIASVESARVEVGDAVQSARGQGVVLAADGKDLWVLRSDGLRVTWCVSDCKRID